MATRDEGDERSTKFPDLEQRFFDLSIDMLAVLGFNGYFQRLNPKFKERLDDG